MMICDLWHLLLLSSLTTSFAGRIVLRRYHGDKVIRIIPKTEGEVYVVAQWIQNNPEVDVWKYPRTVHRNIDIHIKMIEERSVVEMLNENKIEYKIIIHDLETLIQKERSLVLKNVPSVGFNYGKYNRYKDIITELERYATTYPSRVSLFNVGKTYEGRSMIGIKITNGDGKSKPIHFMDGVLHAREWFSTATLMLFIRELIKSNETTVTGLLSKYDIHILPVFNADGYEYSHQVERLWRKTRSNTSDPQCIGVDPNRNWDYKFGGIGTSANPCSNIYHGPHAFSEIEVKNVATYLANIRNLRSYWNVHCYSNLLLTPWSFTKTYPDDYNEMERVGKAFQRGLSKKKGTNYTVGPPSIILYSVSGGSIDWSYGYLGVIYSYTPELTNGFGFTFPEEKIIPTAEEVIDGFLAALKAMK